jgi:hypothetical protein
MLQIKMLSQFKSYSRANAFPFRWRHLLEQGASGVMAKHLAVLAVEPVDDVARLKGDRLAKRCILSLVQFDVSMVRTKRQTR